MAVRAVSKKYRFMRPQEKKLHGAGDDFWALKDVSLEIPAGKITGIIGRNGAGKTTLLNIIAGVLEATTGTVERKGRVVGLFTLGAGFQDELTGRENIFLNGAILGATRAELEAHLQEIIEFSELGAFIDMPLGSYSQGMRLRLGFSIVAHLDFDVMVMDEILAVGDIVFQDKCFKRLVDFRRAGKTLIITSQGMEMVERLCDAAALIDHGSILWYGDAVGCANRYRELLNKERFFVGPVPVARPLIESTKRWADTTEHWGKSFGTNEAVIEGVTFLDRHNRVCTVARSGDPLTTVVRFVAKEALREPHFGIAIFREDGAYCYGPNTQFDGFLIPRVEAGPGEFRLSYRPLLLAPGEYRLSVAIWDKNETLAFNYHDGYYRLRVADKEGAASAGNPLACLPHTRSPKFSWWQGGGGKVPALPSKEQWGTRSDEADYAVSGMSVRDQRNVVKDQWCTNDPATIALEIAGANTRTNDACMVWLGVYRDDGLLCQSMTFPYRGQGVYTAHFPVLSLLPGGYCLSGGVWDTRENRFRALHHGTVAFKMVFDRQDHGTVYMPHSWEWKFSG